MKNKKAIIAIIVFLIIMILLILLFNKKESKNIDMKDVIDIVDYENSEIVNTVNANSNISEKYNISSSSIVESVESITFGEYTGKVLYVRDDNFKANIFQIKNKIAITEENSAPLLAQVNTYLVLFKNQALKFLKISKEVNPKEEKVIDEEISDIPIREQIYIEKKTYSMRYEVDGTLYDINFYMDEDYLVCEIVKIL